MFLIKIRTLILYFMDLTEFSQWREIGGSSGKRESKRRERRAKSCGISILPLTKDNAPSIQYMQLSADPLFAFFC